MWNKHKDGTPIFEDPKYTFEESELKDDKGTYVSGDRLFVAAILGVLIPVWGYFGWYLAKEWIIPLRLILSIVFLYLGFFIFIFVYRVADKNKKDTKNS